MCGISGFWGPRDPDLLRGMAHVQRHRGPDDDGFLETDVASLGFRRLSIIDIEGGHQPLSGCDPRLQLVYNGEVYNYRELRAELEALGHHFHTHSDSETVVHAYEEWGTDAFQRFNGMWAFALLDLRDAAAPRLVLCRDHFGIKPLYWTRSGDRVLFASEIKALLRDAGVRRVVNEQRLYDYLTTGIHDHTDETFFGGIQQLQWARYAIVDAAGVQVEQYWQPQLSSDGDPSPERFRELFLRSIERRLVADVPVGTCLSGGLDSSSIVSCMTELLRAEVPDAHSMGDRLKTFSALFDGDPIDERRWMRPVIEQTHCDNVEIRPSSARFFDEVEDFVWHVEEPTVSTGPYAQWCVQRVARQQVTVLLDGQGGDELLAGYVPYQFHYLRQLRREGRWLDLAREAWGARDTVGPLVRRRLSERRKGFPLRTLLGRDWASRMRRTDDPRSRDDLKLRLLQDLTTFSLPSALRYEDRNSMAHSLEARLPFLDQELVEHVLSLPASAIVHRGWSRAILRDGLRGLLPDEIRLRRKKIGFTTPEMRWLKAHRVRVQSLFRSESFTRRPYFDGPAVARAWHEACQGRMDDHLFFWRAICTEIWLRVFFDEARTDAREDTSRSTHEAAGDRPALDREPALAALAAVAPPNAGRQLVAFAGQPPLPWARMALRSRMVGTGDDLAAILDESLETLAPAGGLRPGDLVAVSEKVVAISQGRSLPVAEIRTSPLARALSSFVTRTPIGIGLGIPATMQLAIEEVGAPRIIGAAAAAAVTRPLGVRGVFYRIAGPQVAAIDGPTPHTIPPYNTHAKRAPRHPEGVAHSLAARLSARAGGAVEVAVIDANDLGAVVLGATPGVDRPLLVELLRDNPLGQEGEQTPFLVVRSAA